MRDARLPFKQLQSSCSIDVLTWCYVNEFGIYCAQAATEPCSLRACDTISLYMGITLNTAGTYTFEWIVTSPQGINESYTFSASGDSSLTEVGLQVWPEFGEGTYKLIGANIYDSSGNIICSSGPSTTTYCLTMNYVSDIMGWTVNGGFISTSVCAAGLQPTDTVGVQANAHFDSSDVGQTFTANWLVQFPDLSLQTFGGSFTVANAGLNQINFDVTSQLTQTGVYLIYGFDVLDQSNVTRCNIVNSPRILDYKISANPTFYISYDFSFLGSDVGNAIGNNINYISSALGPHLSIPDTKFQYIYSSWNSNTLRYNIYIRDTSISAAAAIYANPGTYTLMSDQDVAGFIAGGLLIIIAIALSLLFGPAAAVVVAILLIIGIVTIGFTVNDLLTNKTVDGKVHPSSPDAIAALQTGLKQVLDGIDNSPQYAGCNTGNCTQNSNTMLGYVTLKGQAAVTLCQQAYNKSKIPVKAGTSKSCDDLNHRAGLIYSQLKKGSISTADAANQINQVLADANSYADMVKATMTCTGGYWNSDKQQCVTCYYWGQDSCLIDPQRAVLIGLGLGALFLITRK